MISIKSYSPQVIEHFNHPKNVGHFDETDAEVGTGQAGCAQSGDCVRIQVRVRGGIIEDICFKAQGACSTIAVASWLTSELRSKPLDELKNLNTDKVLATLGLAPVKKHSVLLALEALNRALASFREPKNNV
jgi:nitrogen fixation NifU-like protein